jgi:hypothetical protein
MRPSKSDPPDDDLAKAVSLVSQIDPWVDAAEVRAAETELVESNYTYGQEQLNQLDERDIYDAAQFESELKDMFGFSWVDDEVREALVAALVCLHDMLEDASATTAGICVTTIKTLMKGHLRGFGRYYNGVDPWPRPSAVVQDDIDTRMPEALRWLRCELAEALKWEATVSKKENGGRDER